jgi:hypothetical protein
MLYHSNNSFIQFRSYSHEEILHKSSHRRSDSNNSVDLFTLVIPKNNDSSLSSLICSICSLPMMKPTSLPCQHTFCFKCLQNHQQIRAISLPIHSNNSLLSNDNQTKSITCQKCFRTHYINSLSDLEENQSVELLINTLLCETCHQLHPSNQLDTCYHCFRVLCPNCYDDHIASNHNNDKIDTNNYHQIISSNETINISKKCSDNKMFKTQSINIEKQTNIESTKSITKIENNENENIDPSQINHPKKKSKSLLRKIINSSRHRRSNSLSSTEDSVPSSPVKPPSSVKSSPPPKLNLDKVIEPIQPTLFQPATPVRRFINLFDQYTQTAEHIKQCKQRQSELDRSVRKLIEVLTTKTNENLSQISYYWAHLKQLALNHYDTKTNHFQLFGYLLKTCCTNFDTQKQVELFFEQNDEINAALQVLLTTLTIINNQQNYLTISQLFDREEQTTIRTLQRHLESLVSPYVDELSFITERINVYDSRFSTWKNSNTTDLDSIAYEWKQIIEHDYPALIETISNDFITKIPQIEKILVLMLGNMKKRLLNTTTQTSNRRTSNF